MVNVVVIDNLSSRRGLRCLELDILAKLGIGQSRFFIWWLETFKSCFVVCWAANLAGVYIEKNGCKCLFFVVIFWCGFRETFVGWKSLFLQCRA